MAGMKYLLVDLLAVSLGNKHLGGVLSRRTEWDGIGLVLSVAEEEERQDRGSKVRVGVISTPSVGGLCASDLASRRWSRG